MCMEDIRIGRRKWVDRAVSASPAAGASAALLPGDARRTRVIFTTDGSGRMDLFPTATVTGTAVLTVPAVGILELDVEDYGSLVMGPWSCNNPTAAAVTIRAVSIIYDSEAAPRPGDFR